jgi:2-keto-myo-inositol isomerase
MIPCMSELTTLRASFDEDVRALGSAGCPALEVWLTKLEEFVARNSVHAARALAADQGVQLAVASAQGGILLTEGDQRRENLERFGQRLQLCAALKIPTIVVIADLFDASAESFDRAAQSLRDAARMAGDLGLRIALEFQATSKFCNNLETALSMVQHVSSPNVGICLDVFHYYTGPSKLEDLERLTRDMLFHVQFSDLAGVPRELATDSERVLPGDGDFQLRPIVDRLEAMGYDGCVSVELMNPQLWSVSAAQVAEISVTALRRVLGQA